MRGEVARSRRQRGERRPLRACRRLRQLSRRRVDGGSGLATSVAEAFPPLVADLLGAGPAASSSMLFSPPSGALLAAVASAAPVSFASFAAIAALALALASMRDDVTRLPPLAARLFERPRRCGPLPVLEACEAAPLLLPLPAESTEIRPPPSECADPALPPRDPIGPSIIDSRVKAPLSSAADDACAVSDGRSGGGGARSAPAVSSAATSPPPPSRARVVRDISIGAGEARTSSEMSARGTAEEARGSGGGGGGGAGDGVGGGGSFGGAAAASRRRRRSCDARAMAERRLPLVIVLRAPDDNDDDDSVATAAEGWRWRRWRRRRRQRRRREARG